MRSLYPLALILALVLGMIACESKPQEKEAKTAEEAKPEEAEKAPEKSNDSGQDEAPLDDLTKALKDPSLAKLTAPEQFKVRFETTQGPIIFEVTRAWSPKGVDRFFNLVKMGYFTDMAFFRVVDGFVAQFGIHGDPEVSIHWADALITDDPVTQSNKAGTLTFATGGPDTRTTQLFINITDNDKLDTMGFSPIAKVIQGMDVVLKLYADYGDGPPYGTGPDQGRIAADGNAYLKKSFPKLDYIQSAEIL